MQVTRLLPRGCGRALTRGASRLRNRHFLPLASRVSNNSIRPIPTKRYFQSSRILFAAKKVTEAELPATVVRAGQSTLRLTDALVQRLNQLQKEENDPQLKLRITVDGGGCNGFLIKFDLDSSQPKKQDVVFELNGAKVVVDDISMDLIRGSTIDFEEELARSAFVVAVNPNAKSSCGCKVSFGVE